MKKLFALLIVAAMVLSLAACGGSEKPGPAEPDTKDAAAEAPQSGEATDAATDEPTDAAPDDTARAAAGKEKIAGEWTMNGVNDISLVFNEDGTGAYNFLTEKNVTFTYLVYISPELSEDECMIKLTCDTGEVEDFRFFFNRDTGHLCFHSGEGGGYHGVLEYDEWTRKAA